MQVFVFILGESNGSTVPIRVHINFATGVQDSAKRHARLATALARREIRRTGHNCNGLIGKRLANTRPGTNWEMGLLRISN